MNVVKQRVSVGPVTAADCHVDYVMSCSLPDGSPTGLQTTTAMQSISTRAPRGRAATSTQARAGGTGPWKVSA